MGLNPKPFADHADVPAGVGDGCRGLSGGSIPNLEPQTLDPQPQTITPKPQTLNPNPQPPNTKHQTVVPGRLRRGLGGRHRLGKRLTPEP